MKVLMSMFLIWFMQTSCSSQEKNAPKELNLEDFRWKNRILLVFSPSDQASTYLEQLEDFRINKDGMQERDILIFHLFPREGFYKNNSIDAQSILELRKIYRVAEQDFSLVLIGKDGGVKLKEAEKVEAARVFALIDAMPMRIQEMKTQKNKN